ncbi:unnamed protein product [Closterium sp. NIES-54]
MAFAGWLRRSSSHRRAASALNSPLPLQLLRQLAPAAIAASYLAEGLAQGLPAAGSFHSGATGVCGSGGSARRQRGGSAAQPQVQQGAGLHRGGAQPPVPERPAARRLHEPGPPGG